MCDKVIFQIFLNLSPFFKSMCSKLLTDWRFNEVMTVRSTLSAKKLSIPMFQDAEKLL